MLNVGRLRILVELHRRQTLMAVAEALSYSTSAVSQQIRQLEKDIGLPLVEPAGRRLVFTLQGEILVKHAEKILADLERAHADVLSSTDQPRGTITIAGFQSAALTLIPQVMSEMQERYPELKVQFIQGEPAETLPALGSAQVDIVIAESYPGMPPEAISGVEFTSLLSDPLWLTMAPNIANELDHRKPLIAQLKHVGWAIESAKTPPRIWVTNECRSAGFEPKIVCESEDLAVQLNFVAKGLAVALLPGLALHNLPVNIQKFPVRAGVQSRNVLVATRSSTREDPTLILTLNIIRQIASQFSPSDAT